MISFIIRTKYVYLIPVNGGWGDFGEWKECPVSCGGSEHSRYRACDNPPPKHNGNACTVDGSTNIETKACNVNPCPGMYITTFSKTLLRPRRNVAVFKYFCLRYQK